MSSTTFAETFDGAARFIRSRHVGEPGIDKVLSDFQRRVSTEVHDPIVNRDLIVEPKIDAQLIGVPVGAVQAVVDDLQRLQLLHVWARARCPNDYSDDDATIVETQDAGEFRAAIEDSCPHCGRVHNDIGWNNLETFLAFSFEVGESRLSLVDLIKPPNRPDVDAKSDKPKPWTRLLERVKRFFAKRDDSAKATVEESLVANRPASIAPTPIEASLMVWKLSGLFLLAAAFCISLILAVFGAFCAIVATGLAFAMFVFLLWVTSSICRASSATERAVSLATTAITSGFGIKAATGFELDANMAADKPWYAKVKFGESDHHFLWAGVVCFVVGHLIVFGMNCRRTSRL